MQEGFGWTNGVILWILDRFGSNLTAPVQCLRISTEVYAKSERKNEYYFVEKNSHVKSSNRLVVLALSIMLKACLLFKMF